MGQTASRQALLSPEPTNPPASPSQSQTATLNPDAIDLRDPRSPTQKRTPLRSSSFDESADDQDNITLIASPIQQTAAGTDHEASLVRERRLSKTTAVDGNHSPVAPLTSQPTHFVYPGKTPANTPLANRTAPRDQQSVDTTVLAAALLLAASSPAKSLAPASSEDKENTPQHMQQHFGSNMNTPTADSRKTASGKLQSSPSVHSSPMHPAVRKALLPVVNANQVH